jgi:hypothetical protein
MPFIPNLSVTITTSACACCMQLVEMLEGPALSRIMAEDAAAAGGADPSTDAAPGSPSKTGVTGVFYTPFQ